MAGFQLALPLASKFRYEKFPNKTRLRNSITEFNFQELNSIIEYAHIPKNNKKRYMHEPKFTKSIDRIIGRHLFQFTETTDVGE